MEVHAATPGPLGRLVQWAEGLIERAWRHRRRRVARRAVIVGGTGLLVVGAGATIAGLTVTSGPLPTPSTRNAPGRLSRYVTAGLSFTYPTSWHMRPTDQPTTSQSNNLVSLSRQPIVVACRPAGVNSQPTPAGQVDCANRFPSALVPQGVYVHWSAFGTPVNSLQKMPGRVTRISGLAAKVQIDRTTNGWCGRSGGQESIRAVIVTFRHNFTAMDACLRGPHLNTHTHEVTAMLESTRFAGRRGGQMAAPGPSVGQATAPSQQTRSVARRAMTATQIARQVMETPPTAGEVPPVAAYAYEATAQAARKLTGVRHPSIRPTTPVWIMTTQWGGSVTYPGPGHPTPVNPTAMTTGIYDAISGREITSDIGYDVVQAGDNQA